MQKRFDLVLKTQITNDPKHLRKCTLYVKYCTESSRNGFFVYKTGEFNMMYTLLWIKNPERAKMIYDISKTGLLLQSEAYKFCHIYWKMIYLYTKLVNLTWFTHFSADYICRD